MSRSTNLAGCRHCGYHHAPRPRGLCWRCFYAPGVRERYATVGKSGRRGIESTQSTSPSPTAALPGTPAKVAVLESRAAAGESLWHPADAPAGSVSKGQRND